MPRVIVPSDDVRGFWLTDMGQRVTQWLPAGEYEVGRTARLAGGDIVHLRRDGRTWYVAARYLESLEVVPCN